MRESLLECLICPICGGEFKISETRFSVNEIEEGTLTCQQCGKIYPILGSIPRFVPQAHYKLFRQTWRNFGFSWRHFAHIYSDARDFLDWISPLTPDFFPGKRVLDAGCGTGMHALFAARFGAREVVAFDLSPAVEVARSNVRSYPQIHLIQADIYHLPLRRGFDHIYSIGVLQHLPDPERAFLNLVRLLKDEGWLSIWVYGYEGTGMVRHLVDPVRRLTSRLPLSLVYVASLFPTALFYLLSRGLFRPLGRNPWVWVRRFLKRIPLSHYFIYMSQFNFTYMHNSIFDQLIAPITRYFRREEVERWFVQAGMKDVLITSRNEMSWRGLGRRSAAAKLTCGGG